MPSAETETETGSQSQNLSALEMFRRRLAMDPDRVFLEVPDGESWTFRQMQDAATALRKRLLNQGVARGDVVGVYQWNDPSWFVTALAIWELGAVAAVCGGQSPILEAVRRFELVQPKVIVATDVPDLSAKWRVLTVDRGGRLVSDHGDPGQGGVEVAAITPRDDEPACIFFTSGTSGDAKAIVKSHGLLAAFQTQTASVFSKSASFRPRMCTPSKPPTISLNPFGQGASFGRLTFRLFVGRPLVMMRKFEVEALASLASRYPLDTLQLTPAMIHMLASTDLTIDLSSLQYVNSSTAPLPVATREAFEKRYGVPVLQAYGSTEGGIMALETLDDVAAGRRGPGAVGRITAESKWRIVDEQGKDVATGEEGELLGSPPETTMMSADGQTDLPLDSEGWYHTGDIGRVDEHGTLYITGRLKEMMIVGGSNVFPAEIEDVLCASDAVSDAVVVAMPDERLGEIPVAGIVWQQSYEGSAAKEIKELEQHARARLARYKVPRRWVTLSEVPLTPNGKPDRQAARQAIKAQASQ